MSGCRIGKVRMKNGGADMSVIKSDRTHFHKSVENMAGDIGTDTHAVGFFVLKKDGQVLSGCSFDSGFTASQLKGACEHMKDCLFEELWGEDE